MSKEFIKKLTDIVEANLANENFGVEGLIREIGMTHSSLHRKLKGISNQTISQFIREVRLKKAKELLLNEDLTVSEIAYQVGFGSPTYFNKCFHEYFGYAPGEFKTLGLIYEPEEEPFNILPKKVKHRKVISTVIIGFIVLIPLTIFLIDKGVFAKSRIANEKSIALLPFKYLSDDSTKQYMADGVMDAILIHLSKIKDLRVISRTSVEQYRRINKTAKIIGKELHVSYLLEGSFLRDGDKSRLMLQLIKTSDEGHVWSNEYDMDWKDIFLVQSEVAETIASELQAIITPEEKQLIRKIPKVELTAYDFYQRGNDEYAKYKFDNNRTALLKTQNLYRKALTYDSTFAQAYTGLAWILWDENYLKASYFKNFTDSILILANRALSFDNQLAEAYCLRGICYYETGKMKQAIEEFDRALKFDPNNYRSYIWKGDISHWIFEDYVDAITYYHEALVRNKGKILPNILRGLARIYLDAGFSDISKQYIQEALSLDGDSALYFLDLGFNEFCLENFEDALSLVKKAYLVDTTCVDFVALYSSFLGRDKALCSYYEKYLELSKKMKEIPFDFSHRIGYAYLKVGRFDKASEYFEQQFKYDSESIKLGRYHANGNFVYYDEAATYAIIGDKVNAYKYLDELNKKKSFGFWWLTFFKHDPLFASIRQEPRFQQILKEVEGKYQKEHEQVRKWLEKQ